MDSIKYFSGLVETIKEVHGLELYPVQIKAIKEMFNGNIINMETGEGKTIVIIATAILKALHGKQVVVVTPNEYLNERDYRMCLQIADKYDLVCNENHEDTDKDERSKIELYDCDILYSSCSEIVFDYLRGKDMVNFHPYLINKSIIIDEIDQVLVDNSGTDYNIAVGMSDVLTKEELSMYVLAKSLMFTLTGGYISVSVSDSEIIETDEYDFIFNIAEQFIYLTDRGENKIKQILNIPKEDLLDLELYSALYNTLKAHFLLYNGIDYIVLNGEVVVVDKNNGRYKKNNKYNSALHLALELKENVDISECSVGEHSINGLFFFSQFEDLVGCSGTAYECRELFREILNTETVKIERNEKSILEIEPCKYYMNEEEKFNEVLKLINKLNSKNLPILIINGDDNSSKEFYEICKKEFPNTMRLTNLDLDDESNIIQSSGEEKSILVSTLISGRGTDIKINEYITNIGGLQIILLTRFLNKRAEIQIMGRAGRQGAEGKVYMFGSYEDSFSESLTKKDKLRFEEWILNKDINKIEKMIDKYQNIFKNKNLTSIYGMYNGNCIKNLCENYITKKGFNYFDFSYLIEEHILSYNLTNKSQFEKCILDTIDYINNIIKGENNNEYNVKSSV